LAELRLVEPPRRAELRRAIRSRLVDLGLVLRTIAEDVLGADSSIDWVGLDPQGGVVLVLVADDTEDLALVARALAQRAWVAARLRDWKQLAPGLGLGPEAPVRVALLAPRFGAAAIAAARALGDPVAAIATYRCIRNGGEVEILLEPVYTETARGEPAVPTSSFRSGLCDADLSLTDEERADLG
jgi:hypothetical protein